MLDINSILERALKNRQDLPPIPAQHKGLAVQPMRMQSTDNSPNLVDTLFGAGSQLAGAWNTRQAMNRGKQAVERARNQPLSTNSTMNQNPLPQMPYQPYREFRQGGSTAPFIGKPIRYGEDGRELAVDDQGNAQLLNDGIGVPQRPSTIIPHPMTEAIMRALPRNTTESKTGETGYGSGTPLNYPPPEDTGTQPIFMSSIHDIMSDPSQPRNAVNQQRWERPPSDGATRPRIFSSIEKALNPSGVPDNTVPPEMQATGNEARGRYTTPDAQLDARIQNRERLMTDPAKRNAPENHPSRALAIIAGILRGGAIAGQQGDLAATLSGMATGGAAYGIDPKLYADARNESEIQGLQGQVNRRAANRKVQLDQAEQEADVAYKQGRPQRDALEAQRKLQEAQQAQLEKDLSRIDHYTQGEDPEFDARLKAAGLTPHAFDQRKGEKARVELMGVLYEKEGKQWHNLSTGELTDTLPVDRGKVLGEDNLTPSQRASNAAIAGREATQDARTQAKIDQNNQVIDSQLTDLRDEKGRLEKAAGYLDLGLTQEQRAAREKERKSQLQSVTNQIRTLERQKKASLVPRVSASSQSSQPTKNSMTSRTATKPLYTEAEVRAKAEAANLDPDTAVEFARRNGQLK